MTEKELFCLMTSILYGHTSNIDVAIEKAALIIDKIEQYEEKPNDRQRALL